MTCIYCGAPGPCDCWKQRLTPQDREAAQAIIMARWTVKQDRKESEARQAEERLLDKRGGNRGQFRLHRRRQQRESNMKRIASVILFAVVLGFLGITPVWAQPQVPSPTPSTTKLAFDHDGINTDGYKIKIDAATSVAITPVCTVVSNVRSCELPFPALTPGAHTLILIAYNIAGEAASDPFAVTVVVIPVKSTNLRIK